MNVIHPLNDINILKEEVSPTRSGGEEFEGADLRNTISTFDPP
jgi:hypothetical protein